MNIKIKVKDPNGAYADPETGQGFSGADPIEVKLTKFICGLIYRGEAEVYETLETRLESEEITLNNLSFPKLRDYAISLGLEFHRGMKKVDLMAWIKKAKGQPEMEDAEIEDRGDVAEALPEEKAEEKDERDNREN